MQCHAVRKRKLIGAHVFYMRATSDRYHSRDKCVRWAASRKAHTLYQKQPCWNLHSNVVECICWEREQKHMLYLFYPVQVCQFYPFYPFYPLNYFIRFYPDEILSAGWNFIQPGWNRVEFYPDEAYPDEILSNPDEIVWNFIRMKLTGWNFIRMKFYPDEKTSRMKNR